MTNALFLKRILAGKLFRRFLSPSDSPSLYRSTMRLVILYKCLTMIIVLCAKAVDSFSRLSQPARSALSFTPSKSITTHVSTSMSRLSARPPPSSSSFDFDNRRSFDFLSLIEVSERTKLQYASTNQSEPLRIYLYLTLTVCLLFSSTLTSAVQIDLVEPSLTITRLLGIASSFLFVRESGFRRKQLNRLELESGARDLPITVSTITGSTTKSLRDFDGIYRFLVLRGTASELYQSLNLASVFRKRFKTSNTILICSSTDGSSRSEWISNAPESLLATIPSTSKSSWEAFFEGLLESSSPANRSASCWFGLNNKGRSFGSGLSASPDLLTLFGRSLRPNELISPADIIDVFEGKSEDEGIIIEKQRAFYDALTSGNVDQMNVIFSTSRSEAVQNIVLEGGALDSWEDNLRDGVRRVRGAKRQVLFRCINKQTFALTLYTILLLRSLALIRRGLRV